jgi:hypothetical protein
MSRRQRVRMWVLAGLAGLAALVAYVGALAVSVAATQNGRWPGWLELVREHPFEAASALAVVAVLAAVVAVWWQERPGGGAEDPAPPPVQPPPDWVVGRPHHRGPRGRPV